MAMKFGSTYLVYYTLPIPIHTYIHSMYAWCNRVSHTAYVYTVKNVSLNSKSLVLYPNLVLKLNSIGIKNGFKI